MAKATETGQDDRDEWTRTKNAKIGGVLYSETAHRTSQCDGSTEGVCWMTSTFLPPHRRCSVTNTTTRQHCNNTLDARPLALPKLLSLALSDLISHQFCCLQKKKKNTHTNRTAHHPGCGVTRVGPRRIPAKTPVSIRGRGWLNKKHVRSTV